MLVLMAVAVWGEAAVAQDAGQGRPGGKPATGQSVPPPADVIIVTAAAVPRARLDSSVSVSVLDQRAIAQGVPRTTAEIFRQIPGIRSESSGGEGNANIAVRGLPVASGGAKFLQLQEDGLPVLQFGDIAFGNTDIFLRADQTVGSIQAVRGGLASTLASNAPGGVINLISKDGSANGGALGGVVSARLGLDYGEHRLDADYGGRIGPSTLFNVGGFVRTGEGPRDAGYQGNRGYQIKANLTQEFGGGYVRLYVKRLDDRAISYLPMPVAVGGSNSDPHFHSIPGFDIKSDTIQSALFTHADGLGADNRLHSTDVRDGMHPVMTTLGAEAMFKPAPGLRIEDRFRWSAARGNFVSPFPAQVASASSVASAVGQQLGGVGTGYSLAYADGPQAGSPYTASNPVMRVALFNVDVDDLGSFVNDFKLTKALGPATLTGGFYKARQKVAMTWTWSSYVMEVKGHNAALLNVVDGSGTALTHDGLYAYGVPFFGTCCQRHYDVRYDIDAPYLSGALALSRLTLDGSVRHDHLHARGSAHGTGQASDYDADGDGTITPVERSVLLIDYANRQPIDYDVGYWSWSLGANYRLSSGAALFARASRGARANADRLLYGDIRADGSARRSDAVNFVNQYELGVKYHSGPVGIYVTGFHALTQESNYEATTQTLLDRSYRATGVELEAEFRKGPILLSGGATWTDARIVHDAITPANEGHRPRRQAKLIYQGTAAYEFARGRIGVNLVGTTQSYAQDSNQLVMPGYAEVNAFALVRVLPRLDLSMEANNLFNALGFTEMEEGAIPTSGANAGYARARSINGRTVSATATYSF